MIKLFVKNLQTAVFIPNLDLSNKIVFVSQLNQELANFFDGDPIILPIPYDAPLDVPRIILKNKDESYTLNISQNRVDLVYNEKDLIDNLPKATLSELVPSLIDKSILVIQSLKNLMSVRIIRLGFIATLEGQTQEKATIYIRNLFLKEKALFNDLYDLNFGILKKELLNSIQSNIWFKVTPLKDEYSQDERIVMVQFDINTEYEKFLNLNANDAYNYLEAAFRHIEDNLPDYLED